MKTSENEWRTRFYLDKIAEDGEGWRKVPKASLAKERTMMKIQNWEDNVNFPIYVQGIIRELKAAYCPDGKLLAAVATSSGSSTCIGTLLHPGDFRIRSSCMMVLARASFELKSVLVMTTTRGIRKAMANPRCSRVVPAEIEW